MGSDECQEKWEGICEYSIISGMASIALLQGVEPTSTLRFFADLRIVVFGSASKDMDEQTVRNIENALTEVMQRFRSSFLGEVVNLGEDKVPFRQRSDFAVPLVTVLGHTYGVRLILDDDKSQNHQAKPALEVSVNVYDDEFDLDRFKEDLAEIYDWENVARLIESFQTREEEVRIQRNSNLLRSLLVLDVDRDVEVVEKPKKIASNVTGRLIDMVLRVRYGLVAGKLEEIAGERTLLASWIYLYCLRPFGAAYRKSLVTDLGRS